MGVLAAWKAGSWIDRVVMVFAVLGFSVPVFVLAYLLIYVFAISTDLLPVQGYVSIARWILAVPVAHRDADPRARHGLMPR